MHIKPVCSVRDNQHRKMFPDKDTDRQYIQKSLGMSRSLFSNLCRDAVVLYFLSDSLQDIWAHPRSARMGEMRRHMRLPAWGSRRRTCVKTFDFPPQYVVWTRHHRGWTRRGFNQGPFHSLGKSGKRRWKRRRGEEEKRRGSGKWMCQRLTTVSPGCHGTEGNLWLVLEMDSEFGFQATD